MSEENADVEGRVVEQEREIERQQREIERLTRLVDGQQRHTEQLEKRLAALAAILQAIIEKSESSSLSAAPSPGSSSSSSAEVCFRFFYFLLLIFPSGQCGRPPQRTDQDTRGVPTEGNESISGNAGEIEGEECGS